MVVERVWTEANLEVSLPHCWEFISEKLNYEIDGLTLSRAWRAGRKHFGLR